MEILSIIADFAAVIGGGGPVVILGSVAMGFATLATVVIVLAALAPRFAPLVSAWKGHQAPEVEPPKGDVVIDDATALEFGDALISACEVPALAIDCDHRIRLYNDGAETLTGWPPEAVMGQDLAILMCPQDARHHAGFVRQYLERYRAGGPRLAGDIRHIGLRHKDGHLIHARARLIHINRGSQVIFAWLSPAQLEGG